MATRTKNTFFSKELYKQGIRKTKAIGIGCAITVGILNFLYVYLATGLFDFFNPNRYSNSLIEDGLIAPFCFLSSLFAFLISRSQFSFLNSRKDSDFYHSIPLKRITVYVSFTAAICSWIAIINAATILINGILFAFVCDVGLVVLQALTIFASYTSLAFVVAGVSVICRMLAGEEFANVFYFLSLMILPKALVFFFTGCISQLNPSIWMEKTLFSLIFSKNPLYYLYPSMSIYSEGYSETNIIDNSGFCILLLFKAFLYLSIGGYLYVKRESQMAGNTSTSRFTKAVFRTLAVFPIMALGLWYAFYEKTDTGLITFFGFAIIVHFVFELIVSKNISKTIKSIPFLFVSLGIAVLYLGAAYGIAAGFRATNPTENEIQSVTLFKDNIFSDKDKYHYNVDVSTEKGINIISSSLESSSNPNSERQPAHIREFIRITEKDGSVKYRRIYISDSERQDFFIEVEKSTEYGSVYIPDTKYIEDFAIYHNDAPRIKCDSKETMEKIVNVFKTEYSKLTPAQKMKVNDTTLSYHDTVLQLSYTYNDTKYRFNVYTDYTPQTTSEILEYISIKDNNSFANTFIKYFNNETPQNLVLYTPDKPYTSYSVNFMNQINQDKLQRFTSSLDKESLSDYSDISKVYMIKNAYYFVFVSLTDEQFNTLISLNVMN